MKAFVTWASASDQWELRDFTSLEDIIQYEHATRQADPKSGGLIISSPETEGFGHSWTYEPTKSHCPKDIDFFIHVYDYYNE